MSEPEKGNADKQDAQITLKPQVVASWIPMGRIVAKPQVIASWIPKGQIHVHPCLLAALVPPSEPSTAIHADTRRKAAREEMVSLPLSRRICAAGEGRADTWRQIPLPDASLCNADLGRRLARTEKASANTLRDTRGSEVQIHADTARILGCCVRRASMLRKIHRSMVLPADTGRRTGSRVPVRGDAVRQIGMRVLSLSWTQRQVIRQQRVPFDTSIRVPVILCYGGTGSPALQDFRDHGIVSFSMTLGELTLSDTFQMETTQPLAIDEAVQGQILDYPFHFLVEETSQKDLVQTVKGMYPKDKLLYQSIRITAKDGKVSAYAGGIARALGLKLDMACDDFTPSQDFRESGMTYQDFLATLFGWTSKLPQRQINVFIRGDTLHILQRGREKTVLDITDWPHGRPAIERKLLRSLWHSTWENGTKAQQAHNEEDMEPEGFSGTISFQGFSRTYRNGFLLRETSPKGETTYAYDGEYLSTKRTHNKDGSTSLTTYTYAPTGRDVYLVEEREILTDPIDDGKEHDSKDWTDWNNPSRTERVTYHTPLGYGWYTTVVYVDGELEGSSMAQGKPGAKASRFLIDQSNLSLGAGYGTDEDEELPRYASLVDTEFPVRGEIYLAELTKSIEWLNRKTQETVTVELWSEVRSGIPEMRHIVDFTERIRLDGKEYFLLSNAVELTPCSLRQSLRMVRWQG